MFEVLYKLIKKHKVSFSCCGLSRDTDTDSVQAKNLSEIPEKIISQKDLLSYIHNRDHYCAFGVYSCNKLYSAEFIRKLNLRFDNNLIRSEDVFFNT